MKKSYFDIMVDNNFNVKNEKQVEVIRQAANDVIFDYVDNNKEIFTAGGASEEFENEIIKRVQALFPYIETKRNILNN